MSDDEIPARDENGIRYLKAYTPANPPTPGDVVWGRYEGGGLIIVGRHVKPKPEDPPAP